MTREEKVQYWLDVVAEDLDLCRVSSEERTLALFCVHVPSGHRKGAQSLLDGNAR